MSRLLSSWRSSSNPSSLYLSDGSSASNSKSYNTFWLLFIGFLALYSSYNSLKPHLRFMWHYFLRPLGKAETQQDRLDQFYEGQAEIYDSTRRRLLRGRKTMLKLVAAQMCERQSNNKPLVWVDIGGGTGWNIETMNEYMPIKSFDTIYLVDLCDPLQIARKRFAAKGWVNVHVLHQEACTFTLPGWPTDGGVLPGSVSLVMLSYSLSMIPSYHHLLDRVDRMLDPTDGLVGVADFYAAQKSAGLHEESIGGVGKLCGWLGHWFWQTWFDFEHVDLSPGQ